MSWPRQEMLSRQARLMYCRRIAREAAELSTRVYIRYLSAAYRLRAKSSFTHQYKRFIAADFYVSRSPACSSRYEFSSQYFDFRGFLGLIFGKGVTGHKPSRFR